ncbi:MAG: YtfJ family protein [Proteobacteria bacterium]|nr:YtfJ family protein [Pseudomonadota bacterium]
MNKAIQIMVVVCLILSPGIVAGEVGHRAPAFTVKNPDGKVLTDKALQGRIALIYYESRDSHQWNQKLKDRVGSWWRGLPLADRSKVKIVSVIDASSANFLTRGVWRRKLRAAEKKNKWTIYGDWSGRMRTAYGLKKDASNIIIIDRRGVIRFKYAGKLDATGIARVKQWLVALSAK